MLMELKNGKVPFAVYFCVLHTKLVRNHNCEMQSLNVVFSVWLDSIREHDFSDLCWEVFVDN